MAEITGTALADQLTGADGVADTITGAAGGDTVSGGAGFDLFVVGDGDSPAPTGLSDITALDVITGWSVADRILFVGASAAVFGSMHQGQAETYAQAYDQAVSAYSGSNREYAAIRVENDVFLFAIRTGQAVRLPGADLADLQRFNITTGTFAGGLIETGAEGGVARTLAGGADSFAGGTGADTILGLDGADTLGGGAGDDRVFGGQGADSISGGAGTSYLRGDEGDDQIVGGDDFDDINGNMGQDSLAGGAGDDWVVGGKDGDVVFGDGGHDLVYGNLGDDTVGGGTGNDIVRGGQGNDLVRGDDGDDIVAGDRGDDTVDGGLGADTFLSFAEAGIDRVLRFNADEGDRVRLDPGTNYALLQVEGDTVIDFGGGHRMILVGVELSSLPDGWIT